MSDFEKWFKATEAYKMMEEQNYFKMNLFFFVTARNQYSHSGVQVAYLTWQHQQAEIDRLSSVLDERTKEWLQAIECGTYFENVAKPLKAENDSLKSQLNNMEACYIHVKKERDDLQVRASELLEGVESAMVQLDNWTTAYEILDELRGEHESFTETRQKVEAQIENGARLTKHQIDL